MRQAIVNLASRRNHGHHPGLLLQRYLALTKKPSDTTKNGNEKSEEYRKLFDAAIQAAGSETFLAVYADAFDRWNASFKEDELHRNQTLSTTGRLIVGLGSENVLETGLRLHHTYGVPIIPASALKGLAAHYCRDVWGQRHSEQAEADNLPYRCGGPFHDTVFGTTDYAGVISFHDAWITPDSLRKGALRLDVMTPHHTDWQLNKAPPNDFDRPNPVSFLSVTGTFQIRLSWNGPVDTLPKRSADWFERTMMILKEALAEWGVGGKTSSGYGRLVDPAMNSSACHDGRTTVQHQNATLPNPGDKVDAVLLDEKTKKGGWKAKHKATGVSGPIQNSADVPGHKNADDELTLIVASASEREIAFRFPTPADEKRAQKTQGKPKSVSGGHRPRGGKR